jgi:hypothetical protein
MSNGNTSSLSVAAARPRVYLDGRLRNDLEVLEWEISPAPTFGRAVLRLTGTPPQLPRYQATTALPEVGASVRIETGSGEENACEFQGRITHHRVQLSEGSEQILLECESLLSTLLAGKVSSAWKLAGSGTLEQPQTQIVFNQGPNSLASSQTFNLSGRNARVFDSDAEAVYWTAAEALAYLLATVVPSEVSVPARETLQNLCGGILLAPYDATGKSAIDALVEIAAQAKLRIRPLRRGLGLTFYRSGREGRVKNVSLQKPGSTLRPDQSSLWQADIQIHHRPSRNSILVLGQRKKYESTFVLSKGWDPNNETTRWRDCLRSVSPNWPVLSSVYRRWVLNEHGGYCNSPWNLNRYELEHLSPEDFRTQEPRRFLPCLSADAEGESLGVAVEIRLDSSDDWRRWRGPLWISQDQCGIYLGGDALPGEFFQAACENTASVRVTATLESDTRLSAYIPGDPQAELEIFDFADRFAWRKVHADSIFSHPAGLSADECDHSESILIAASQLAETTFTKTQATLTLARIDTSYQVGDLVEKITGREIPLSGNPHSLPSIERIFHRFDRTQTTELQIQG